MAWDAELSHVQRQQFSRVRDRVSPGNSGTLRPQQAPMLPGPWSLRKTFRRAIACYCRGFRLFWTWKVGHSRDGRPPVRVR
jgi:hypothetical protein